MSGGHHLILGTLRDIVTGEILTDTHDERYRQKLARLLLENKGYLKNEIGPRCDLLVSAGNQKAIIKVDFKITLSVGYQEEERGRVCMIVKYGPGSLVTRHQPALAMSRLLVPYQIPFVVVTNGEDADILDAGSGKLTGSGIDAVPSKSELTLMIQDSPFDPIPAKRAEMESRIVYAYEVVGACPCDDTICRMENGS